MFEFAKKGSSLNLGAMLLAVCASSVLAASAAQADNRVAKVSGDWNSTTTWGGAVPMVARDSATIPAGISVTIAAGSDVALFLNGDAGRLTVLGNLVIAGKATLADLIVEPGGTVTNVGSLSTMRLYVNKGSMLNRGTILNQASWYYEYGAFTNDSGATVDNRGMLSFSSIATHVNRGTILNNAGLDIYAPFENYGTITNGPARVLGVYRNLRNFAGAKITSEGAVKVHGAVTIRNDGSILNAGSYFENEGKIINSCSGTFSGTAPSLNAPQVSCSGGPANPPPAPAPTAWQVIGAGMAWSSISAGSASKLTGTGMSADGKSYLLTWSGDKFVPYTFPGTTTKLEMAQASIGADGTWWAVKADQTIWRHLGSTWGQVPGELKQVSVGAANHIWGVNAQGAIWSWSGAGWTRVTGELTQVSVGSDGAVWGITPGSKIVMWNGSSWTLMPGEATQVAVGSASNVLVCNAAGTVYKWNGGSWLVMETAPACKTLTAAADGTSLAIRISDRALLRKP